MKFIKKMFIKNYSKTDDPDVRNKYGLVAGIIGMVSNIFLFIMKIIIGLISASITIIVDAVGNLTDAGNSVITLIGFKISSKPPDREHPFGHARIEYITGLFISLIVFAVGVLFAKSCIDKIITPEEVTINIWIYIILGISIGIKLFQLFMFRSFAKSINSDTLKANATDATNDTLTTTAVLISMIVMDIFSINIDGYIGLAVSLFIIYSSIIMIKDTIGPLISEMPNKRFVNKIKRELLSFDGVKEVHDLLIHTYGKGVTFATVHIDVPATSTLLGCHELVDKIERHFEDKLNINLTIQIDPVDKSNPVTKEILQKVKKAVRSVDKKLEVHSLRVIYKNDEIHVLFDIQEDFDMNIKKSVVSNALNKHFEREELKYIFKFTIDKPFM